MNNNHELEVLLSVLGKSWCAETAKGVWRKDVPSLNQCAVTALIVQDFFGGVLLRCVTAKGNSHYWNLLPSGEQIDLSSEQFKFIDDIPLSDTAVERTREYVLSFPDTFTRYHLLVDRVRHYIPSPLLQVPSMSMTLGTLSRR